MGKEKNNIGEGLNTFFLVSKARTSTRFLAFDDSRGRNFFFFLFSSFPSASSFGCKSDPSRTHQLSRAQALDRFL